MDPSGPKIASFFYICCLYFVLCCVLLALLFFPFHFFFCVAGPPLLFGIECAWDCYRVGNMYYRGHCFRVITLYLHSLLLTTLNPGISG